MKPVRHIGRHAVLLAVAAAILAAAMLLQPSFAASGETNGLQAAWERARSAGSYSFFVDIQQTMIPRPVAANIGQQEQRLDMVADGDVHLPDRSRLNLRVKNGDASAQTVTIVQEGDETYIQKGDRLERVTNLTSLAAPGGDFMAYLAAATNVRQLPLDPIAYPPAAVPGHETFTRYAFDIDGARLADYMREQAAARAQREAGQPVDVQSAPLLKRLAASGELWVDAQGLPRHQIIDLESTQAQDGYDVKARLIADYRNFGPVAALSGPLPGATETTWTAVDASWAQARALSFNAARTLRTYAPLIFVLLLFVLFTAVLVVCRNRRWLYVSVATLTILGMVSSPLVSSLRLANFFVRQAEAAPLQPLAEALGVDMAESDSPPVPTSGSARAVSASASGAALQGGSGEYLVNDIEACGDGDRTVDTDGDGLNDLVESCLGTNPSGDDTDGDGIPDGVEAYGIVVTDTLGAGHVLISDPFKTDSLGDGSNDSNKWPRVNVAVADGRIQVSGGHVVTLPDGSTAISRTIGLAPVWDIDGDRMPNVWDIDMDGDGVPNQIDASPRASTTGYASKLSLSVQGGGYEGYKYVTLNIRPQNSQHLLYPDATLEWPLDDSEGQMQHINNPSGNYTDSLRLVPMLQIDASAVPSAAAVDQSQLIIRQLSHPDDPSKPWQMLAPLTAQSVNGTNYMLASQVVYGPEDGDDIQWTVRLVWMVVGKTDAYVNCSGEDRAATNCRITTDTTVLQSYDDVFQVTGFSVAKSGPTEVALIGTPNTPTEDSDLYNIYIGLTNIYQQYAQLENQAAGSTALKELETRFNAPNIGLEYRWGVTQTVEVQRTQYDHRLAAAVGTADVAKTFLETHYPSDSGAMCSGADGATFKCTSLLVAMEAHEGVIELSDMPPAITGATGILSLGANLADVPLFTLRMVNLKGYEHTGVMWRAMDAARVYEVINQRYAPQIPDLLISLRETYPNATAWQVQFSYVFAYTVMMSQMTVVVQADGQDVLPAAPEDETQLVLDLGLALPAPAGGPIAGGVAGAASVAGGPRLAVVLPAALTDLPSKIWSSLGSLLTSISNALTSAGQSAGTGLGKLRTALTDALGKAKVFMGKHAGMIGAISLFVAISAITVGASIVTAIQGFCPDNKATLEENDRVCAGVDARKLDVANKVFMGLNVAVAAWGVFTGFESTEKALKVITKIGSAAKTLSYVFEITGVVLSGIAAAIGIAVTWYSCAMAAKQLGGDSPYLKTMKAQSATLTILLILLVVLSIALLFAPVVISVIVAIVFIFDALLAFISVFIDFDISITSWVVFAFGMAFYQAVLLTEVTEQGFIDSSAGPVDPLKGVVAGSHFQVNSTFRGVIRTTNKLILMSPLSGTAPSAYHGDHGDLDDSTIYAGMNTITSGDATGVPNNGPVTVTDIDSNGHEYTNNAGVDFTLNVAKNNVVLSYTMAFTSTTKYVSCGPGHLHRRHRPQDDQRLPQS